LLGFRFGGADMPPLEAVRVREKTHFEW